MAYQCPECGQEFEMQTEYCPACGKPMNPEAYRIAKKNEAINSRLLPLKWYKFLIWFSIPLSIVLMCVTLYQAVSALMNFDPALYKPEYLHLVRFSMYLELGAQVVLFPLMIYGECALVKKKWKGVLALLWIYGLQAVYALAGMVILLMAAADVTTTAISVGQMIFMFFVNRVYFNKRRSMFE